ncbi:helix-turn-helix domain-containing protein [Limnospira indica]|nr:helix-turn-helix domain-containing protein [Limnospira indica]
MQQWFPTAECLYRRGLLAPQEAALLREKFLCQFRELLDHTFEQRGDRQIFKPTRRYWIFATVQAMIDSNLAKNFTNEELCQQCCISPRAMQYAFKEITGVGVQQYIRARKLNAVREELCGPSADPSTIYAIASAYGFSHMGRFSEQFYRCFGEYPSTLKKLHKSDIKMRKSMIS